MSDGNLSTIEEENEEALEVIPTSSETQITGQEVNSTMSLTDATTQVTEETRECAVCLETISEDQRSIQPCRCQYWVHYVCLLHGILEYEDNNKGCAPLGCRFCKIPYNISPRCNNWLVRMCSKAFCIYDRFSQFGSFVATVVIVESTFTVFGLAALYKILGHEAATKLEQSLNPIECVALCKAIVLISSAVNFISWEAKFLHFLRRFSRLPVVGNVFPSMDLAVRETRRPRTMLGTLVGGLLLPFNAVMVGNLMFGAVQSNLHRVFLGGFTFLSVKGVLQMYYRQKMYTRQCLMTVEDYRGD